MQLSIALLSAAVAVAAVQPAHRHGHQRLHQEQHGAVSDPSANLGEVLDKIEVVYVLNGKKVPEHEVQQGIKNGTLIFAEDGELASAPPKGEKDDEQIAPPPPPPSYDMTTTSVSQPTPTTETTTSVSQVSTVPPPKPTPTCAGVDLDFPDGELPCDTFPSDYGAVPVEWTGLGGWTGVQCPGEGSGSSGYDNIRTAIVGEKCREGSYCSYACPPGYQKSQWPTRQGATGQSIGGIQCRNGKLHLTNPGLSKKLCMKGTDKVQILVKNKCSKNVAVCRTDYPGTESETVPVDVQPGQTANLTCPDADNYYVWQGGSTSAQYYVNPAGVPVEQACQWGTPDNPWGNFAPLNIGVGYSNGAAWLSIFQNAPTTNAKLEFSVEIIGDTLSGSCRYSNGQYCSDSSCSPTTGCTVSLKSGTAIFVFC